MVNSLLYHLVIVLLPLILSNVLHMLVIKRGDLAYLNYPLYNKVFGSNKTWRGLVFVPIANAISLKVVDFVFQLNLSCPLQLGVLLGWSYMLFELPNSFVKRKLGILPGEQSHYNSLLFSLIDKTDSAFGVSLVYFLLGYVDFKYAIIIFMCSSLAHIIISKLLVQIKLKKTF